MIILTFSSSSSLLPDLHPHYSLVAFWEIKIHLPGQHYDERILRGSVFVCHSLMVSGLGRWCGGWCRTWCHKKLPEVIIGQLGPEVIHFVNTDA